MELSENQKYMYNLGEQARQNINNDDISFKNAIRILIENYNWIDKIEEIQNNKDRLFFEAGYDNFEPRYVKAIRYGEIPQNGYSMNYSTNEFEKGVSCIKIVNDNELNYNSIYDITLGLQDIEKIVVNGWYLGNSGSDGEPLLVNATKIR